MINKIIKIIIKIMMRWTKNKTNLEINKILLKNINIVKIKKHLIIFNKNKNIKKEPKNKG